MHPNAKEEQTPAGLPGLTEGRIVHYVLPNGRSAGQHRPAIVVRFWNQHSPDMCNLQVFTDFSNDFSGQEAGNGGTLWATSVHYDENKTPGTWHWIEKA